MHEKKRVLIVDDEEDLTWTLSKKLSKDKDKFELVCVNSGREAIEILNQLPFDLVITDVRMPEVSGLDLLVKIKNRYSKTKVVIMTAYGTSDVHKEANERGCFNYIEKPFEINELRQMILDALEQKRGFNGSVSDFQLSDIIQLNCLGRLTSAIKVNSEDESGMIYFQEGNIIHAETDKLFGELAFYHIMNWHSGEFKVVRYQTVVQETISRSWQSLLLESMQRIDENSPIAKEEAEREKQRRQKQLHHLLNKIYRAGGVEHVLLHSKAGFPFFYEGLKANNLDFITELGNYISAMLDGFQKSSKFLKGGDLLNWVWQFKNRLYILQRIPVQDAYISIIGKPSINSGFIRMELKKNLTALSQLL